jgi:hypothetical protein
MIRRAACRIALALSFVTLGAAFLGPGAGERMPVRVELAIVALKARRDAFDANGAHVQPDGFQVKRTELTGRGGSLGPVFGHVYRGRLRGERPRAGPGNRDVEDTRAPAGSVRLRRPGPRNSSWCPASPSTGEEGDWATGEASTTCCSRVACRHVPGWSPPPSGPRSLRRSLSRA